ncbi:MAG: tRNA 2-thiouridine(34) synthase MnmA [bacterium]|jgi:tRNA-specific 2-thiouridylase|nr:tRNA 2-thiouridine(34) synthase MnmA [bacterium]
MPKPRILLMMSGGVDSSVSAALLQEQGYEVVGLTLEQYKPDPTLKEHCTDIEDARHVAQRLGFEHHVLNTEEKFYQSVILHFVESYKNGLTPNPCTHCNRNLKFQEAYEFAQKFNCAFFATGHYARLLQDEQGRWGLYRAIYKERDQSYFLYGVRRELVPLIRFPLGDKNKEQVREVARRLGMKKISEKEGSQDICFTKGTTYNEFLSRFIPSQEGPILSCRGEQLGTHSGITNYTIGQRKGLGLAGGPFYVCEIDPRRNAVIIGSKEDLARCRVTAIHPRWMTAPAVGDRVMAQIRSRHVPAPAVLVEMTEDQFTIEFAQAQYGVAPGQALVISIEEQILGGGEIHSSQ